MNMQIGSTAVPQNHDGSHVSVWFSPKVLIVLGVWGLSAQGGNRYGHYTTNNNKAQAAATDDSQRIDAATIDALRITTP
jgi:hypothetical protein